MAGTASPWSILPNRSRIACQYLGWMYSRMGLPTAFAGSVWVMAEAAGLE